MTVISLARARKGPPVDGLDPLDIDDSAFAPLAPPDPVEEVLARYGSPDPFTFAPTMPTRWAWQRSLREDAEDLYLDASADDADDGYRWGSEPEEVAASPRLYLPTVLDRWAGTLEEWAGIGQEVFALLFDKEPASSIRPSLFAISVRAFLDSLEDWQELRRVCRKQRATTLQAATRVLHELGMALSLDDLADDKDAKRTPESIIAEAQKALDEGASQEAVDAVFADALAKAEARRGGLMDRLDHESGLDVAKQQQAQQIRAHLQQHLQEILKEAESNAELTEMLRACGLGGSGAGQGGEGGERLDPVNLELLRMLQKLPHLKDLVNLVGRMQRASKEHLTPSEIRIRPDGLQQSRDDLVLSELVLADVAPDVWLKRWLDKETLGIRRVGEEPLAQGDIVVVVDDSGSMYPNRAQWAKALAGAVMLEALAAHRRCVLCLYSSVSSGQYKDVAVLDAGDLPEGFRTLATSYGGGTETRTALLRAAAKLEAPLREPDILLITDGDWEDLREHDYEALKGPDGRGRLYTLLLAAPNARDVPGATKTWNIPELTLATTSQVLQAISRAD